MKLYLAEGIRILGLRVRRGGLRGLRLGLLPRRVLRRQAYGLVAASDHLCVAKQYRCALLPESGLRKICLGGGCARHETPLGHYNVRRVDAPAHNLDARLLLVVASGLPLLTVGTQHFQVEVRRFPLAGYLLLLGKLGERSHGRLANWSVCCQGGEGSVHFAQANGTLHVDRAVV